MQYSTVPSVRFVTNLPQGHSHPNLNISSMIHQWPVSEYDTSCPSVNQSMYFLNIFFNVCLQQETVSPEMKKDRGKVHSVRH